MERVFDDVQEAADFFVEKYAARRLSSAMDRVEMIMIKEKGFCQCLTCTKEAVSEANSWIEWVDQGTRKIMKYRYEIVVSNNGFYIQNK